MLTNVVGLIRSWVKGPYESPSLQKARILREKMRLESFMGDRNSAYWLGTEAAGLQKYYRDLVTVEAEINRRESLAAALRAISGPPSLLYDKLTAALEEAYAVRGELTDRAIRAERKLAWYEKEFNALRNQVAKGENHA